jgi:hypothetical protein
MIITKAVRMNEVSLATEACEDDLINIVMREDDLVRSFLLLEMSSQVGSTRNSNSIKANTLVEPTNMDVLRINHALS